MYKHLRRAAAASAAALLSLYGAAGYYAWKLPDSFYIGKNSTLSMSTALPVTASEARSDALAAISSDSSGTGTSSLRLFGIIPIKNAEVQEIETPMLVPGGQPFGIKLQMDGVMIINTDETQTASGTESPAEEAGLRAGDIIHCADGISIASSDDLRHAIEGSEGQTIDIEFTRNDKAMETELTPVYSSSEGCYTAGVWVRDSLAGIGTLTFYEPETLTFGGLGHPICDGDTGVCIPIGQGNACPVTVSDLVKGSAGSPGMLEGTFLGDDTMGSLVFNNRCGVFGTLSSKPSSSEAIPMAFKQEVRPGKAEIICTVSGTEPETYSAEIEEIDMAGSDNIKNMIIRITDKRLLEKTGGIVQGMSGSPVIQNGKLVGAVTHVFVDDPTRGYGIFCENMYRQCTSFISLS